MKKNILAICLVFIVGLFVVSQCCAQCCEQLTPVMKTVVCDGSVVFVEEVPVVSNVLFLENIPVDNETNDCPNLRARVAYTVVGVTGRIRTGVKNSYERGLQRRGLRQQQIQERRNLRQKQIQQMQQIRTKDVYVIKLKSEGC